MARAAERDDQVQDRRLRVVWYRREQCPLRNFLLGSSGTTRCDLCGTVLPTRLVTTARIKLRAQCSDTERRDHHVMAACLLGCDALFERGYVLVDGAGIIRAGRPTPLGLAEAVDSLNGRVAIRFSDSNAAYFAWHATGTASFTAV